MRRLMVGVQVLAGIGRVWMHVVCVCVCVWVGGWVGSGRLSHYCCILSTRQLIQTTEMLAHSPSF